MKKIIITLIAFIVLLSTAFAGTGTVTGTLMDDNGYYYISLGPYSSSNSLQSIVKNYDSINGGYGISYNNQTWTLDNNSIGQHITIDQNNISDGTDINLLVGDTFTFTYQTDDSGCPILTIFNGRYKDWLVVTLTCTNPELQSVDNDTLHTSIAECYNNYS